MAKFIRANEQLEQLCEALAIDPHRVRRVIIDLQVNQVATVYVEQYGTTELLELLTPIVEHGIVFKTGEDKAE